MRRVLSEKERFCLDGWMANGNATMAYLLSRDVPTTTDNPTNLSKMASRWLNLSVSREYIASRRRVDYSKSKEVVDDIGNRTRADAERELNTLVSTVQDPKLKADILLKLADLNRWKQQEQTEEDKAVTFYIPLSYDRCDELMAYMERYYSEQEGGGEGGHKG